MDFGLDELLLKNYKSQNRPFIIIVFIQKLVNIQ